MIAKYVFLDFEFNSTTDPLLNLVSVSYSTNTGDSDTIWLHKDKDAHKLVADRFNELNRQGYIFVAYNVVAEARAFFSLGLDPFLFKWIDLYLEYRCITNHSELMYGKQLIKGKVVTTHKPTYDSLEHENNSKPEYSLSACCFKLLGVTIDTKEKDEVRDLIISKPEVFTQSEIDRILKYNASDIVYLPQILEKIYPFHRAAREKLTPDKFREQMFLRSLYSVETARMERIGYPINYEHTKNFSNSVGTILGEIAIDMNEQFPDDPPFKWNKPKRAWSQNQQAWRDQILKTPFKSRWSKTDKGSLSLSLEAFEEHYHFRHEYPRNNFGAQALRYLKTKQSLNGFKVSDKGSKKNFWDSYSYIDGRVRPYMNIYGAQSSRSQPSASSFIPLKAAWMRALIEPKPSRAIAGIDYSSQEFLLAALLSGDEKMVAAYETGDVYLAFAKDAGMVPQNATKHSHPTERQLAKSTVLGISYNMSKFGLSAKLTQDSGTEYSEEKAQELIDLFHKTYPDYTSWKNYIRATYPVEGYLELPCGWVMFGENENWRSAGNFPVQGCGASIMRKAVTLARLKGLDVIFTNHDAIYIEYDSYDFNAIQLLFDAMFEASVFYFKGTPMEVHAKKIRMDGETWSRDYWFENGSTIKLDGLKVAIEEIHIDERSVTDYERFKKYFRKEEEFF